MRQLLHAIDRCVRPYSHLVSLTPVLLQNRLLSSQNLLLDPFVS